MACSRFCLGSPFPSPWDKPGAQVVPMAPGSYPDFCTRLHTPRRSQDIRYTTEPVVLNTTASSHHALVMLTAPRREPCLEATLDSMLKAGLADWPGPRLLVVDGPVGKLPSDWVTASFPRAAGSSVAFVRALRLALALDPKLDHLTFVEDDVEWCQNALDHVARIVVPTDVAFVTWFTYDYDYTFPVFPRQSPHPSESKNPVLAIRSTRYFILTQACTFPRATVDRILSCPHITDGWPKIDSHDEMISWALGDALYAVHFPILLQHTGGLNSAVLLSRGKTLADSGDPQADARTSPYFVGVDFDAHSLSKNE